MNTTVQSQARQYGRWIMLIIWILIHQTAKSQKQSPYTKPPARPFAGDVS
ncbi:MAG: hypothetical protein ACOYOS_01445 [Syntrophales bacterium]